MKSRLRIVAAVAGWLLLLAVPVYLLLAAPGDTSVTSTVRNGPYSSNTTHQVSFTLNGTGLVTTTVGSGVYPVIGGAVQGTTNAGGTVRVQLWDGGAFGSATPTTGQIFDENFASGKLQAGLFEAVTVGADSFMLSPTTIYVGLSSGTATDTATGGTLTLTFVH